VDNATDRKLAEVAYAILGGQQGIGNRMQTQSMIPGSPTATNLEPELFSHFNGTSWYATPFAYTGYTYPGAMSMGWMDVYNAKTGVGYYYANQDPETRVTNLYMELHPYMKRGSPKDNWPTVSELPPGEPVGLTMAWVNFPYLAKGTFRAGPVALQGHAGDWHAAAKLYRGWFDQHFKVARSTNWLRKEMAWASVNLLTPEDEIGFRFKDLPKVAADAKKYDVTTLLIFGWPVGGQDRGRPNYIPDPRLGTREEFRKALADIRAMGVHPLLGANIHMGDTSTQTFKTRYSRFAVQGRWTPNLSMGPRGFGTVGARVMDTARYFTLLSPSHPEYREEVVGQYLDLIRDGAEGIEMDGSGTLAILDFNPAVPTSPDRSLPQGVQAAYAEFLNRARQINPDTALTLQESFDRNFPYSETAFPFLEDGTDAEMPLSYTFPEWVSNAGVTVPEGYDGLSNGLRYGLILTISPREHTATMDEPLTQPTSRYMKELIRIRKQYADLLFFGRFDETEGAAVVGDTTSIRYSVFSPEKPNSPQRAVVVVNYGDRQESATVSIKDKDGQQATVSVPFEADRVTVLPVKLTLPAHRAAVVVSGSVR
jgi:hypothetical protein